MRVLLPHPRLGAVSGLAWKQMGSFWTQYTRAFAERYVRPVHGGHDVIQHVTSAPSVYVGLSLLQWNAE